MITDDYKIPECRTLYTNGSWTPDAPEDLKRNFKLERPMGPEEKRPAFAHLQNSPVMIEAGALRVPLPVTYGPRNVGRPRINRLKVKPHAGRGQDWNRKENVTVERIMELQKQGMLAREIAKELGCCLNLIFRRLATIPKGGDVFEKHENLHVCSCGNGKWPTRKVCELCLRKERQGEKAKLRICACKRPKRATADTCKRCREKERYRAANGGVVRVYRKSVDSAAVERAAREGRS